MNLAANPIVRLRPTWRPVVRAVTVAGVVAGVLLATAAPAGADPPGPTDDVSRIIAVQPATPVLSVDVVGGDAFLRVRVEPGHELVVRGYQDEPYVRIDADGAVFENERSPAVALNQDRFGSGASTEGTDAAAPPQWRPVAGDGTYVWHDHRIHWMAPTAPPQLDGAESGKISDWTVPLLVDGALVEVRGELVRRPPPSLAPGLALAVGVAALTVLAGWRRPIEGVAGVFTLVGLAATVTSLVAELGVPAAAGRQYAHVVVAAVATTCAAAALAARRSRYAWALTVGAVVILPLWIGLRWGVLTHAVLPTSTGEAAQRAAVAAAVGAVIGALALGGRALLAPPAAPARGGLVPPSADPSAPVGS